MSKNSEVQELRSVKRPDERIRKLRQGLMDIMTGNVVVPYMVPEPILKLANDVLKADDAEEWL